MLSIREWLEGFAQVGRCFNYDGTSIDFVDCVFTKSFGCWGEGQRVSKLVFTFAPLCLTEKDWLGHPVRSLELELGPKW
jgi:hypothetical protein